MIRPCSASFVGFSAFLLLAGSTFAAPPPEPAQKPDIKRFVGADNPAPVDITSERAELLEGGRTVVFHGKVVATRGDATLKCKKLTAALDEAGALSSLHCAGDVEMVRGTRRAVAAEATYQRAEDLLILTGDPVLTQGENRLRGERIAIHLATDRVEVSSPRARLVPKEGAGASAGGEKP